MAKLRGFKENQNKIVKEQNISKESAGAILAAATRRASKAARKKNPNLNKVK